VLITEADVPRVLANLAERTPAAPPEDEPRPPPDDD
jgi:hypothetical protein